MSDRSIVLTGFMGTGKTAVGRALAEALGRPFVDMDAVLEERLGMTISACFASAGETAFREAEAALARELAPQRGLVIATGGGALVPEANRKAFLEHATVVLLECAPEEILRRLEGTSDRPLLAGADPREAVERLLESRRAAYEAIPLRLDVTHLSIPEVAECVQRLAGLGAAAPLQVLALPAAAGGYDVAAGEGLLGRSASLLRAVGVEGRAVVVTEPRVRRLHGAALERALSAGGIRAGWLEVPSGEAAKTYATLQALYDGLLRSEAERGTPVIALGGGALSDVAGFAAATWLRGLPWIVIPTTLLAQVDAGIGGKVAIDHPGGKNLIGAFHPPRLVVVDPELLRTLPPEELRAGLAEVVKHGIIGAPELFRHLETHGPEPLGWTVPQAVRVKVDVVAADPMERGRRVVLNLGHTTAHALERLSGFSLRHGEAVSIGMVTAARLAVRLGLCEAALEDRLVGLLQRLGLPVRGPRIEPDRLWAAMSSDKKRQHGAVRFVLPVRLGEVVLWDGVSSDEFAAAWREVMADA
ncbi:MAG: 3-dehydroquinate synthase [Anaerolineae bacterium]|nr:3-dehydroquinate synthase [Anaerolineae bacterium]